MGYRPRHSTLDHKTLETTRTLADIYDGWDSIESGTATPYGDVPYRDNGRHRRKSWGVSLVKLSA
ncbi:hypothetical protein SEA_WILLIAMBOONE_193 [Gordonia phage WilliamBoone]|nr:hypothetical protein SEA_WILLIAMBOONE_193 [Gordonia phage WilliamBoone]